jgi:hypothetical protein
MKYLRIFGLAAVAAAATMAFLGAGTASAATTLCTVTETECKGAGNMWGPGQAGMEKIVAVSQEGTDVTRPTLTAPFGNISCNSELEGPIEMTGGGSGIETTPTGIATKLTWTECAGGTAETHQKGRIIIHWDSEHNGTVTFENFFVKVTQAGIPCYYSSNGVEGTLTGGNPAIIHITAEPKVFDDNDKTNSSAFCPEKAPWHATYKITNGPVYVSHH